VIWISSGEHPPREEGTSSDGGARRTERRATTPTTRGPSAPGPIDVVVDDPGQGLPPIGDGFGRAANGGDREDGPGSVGGDGVDAPFDANVVEVAARLRPGSPVPRYPDELRDARLEGRVLARFVVDTAGRVEPASVRIVSSTHPLFASAVRAILPTLRFTPARARGTKVRQLVELPFEFEVGR
jgi:protein TonB